MFSPPHNGGSKVENLRIMRNMREGDMHTYTHSHKHTQTQEHTHACTCILHYLCANIWVHLCSEGYIWACVLQVLWCYYYRKMLVPLSSSPPSCSPLILSYITPVSNGELDPEVSSVPAIDAIRGFTLVISVEQWNKICLWFRRKFLLNKTKHNCALVNLILTLLFIISIYLYII